MATPNTRGAYDLLWRAMQQNALQQQRDDSSPTSFGAPEYDPDGYGSPQGGLLGRLLALQAEQNPYQPPASNNRAAPSVSADPNFRQLSRMPAGLRRPEPAAAWPVSSSDGNVTSGLGPAAQEMPVQYAAYTPAAAPSAPPPKSDSTGLQKIGTLNGLSGWCRLMKIKCHNECINMIYGRDAFGPYRACVRQCMQNAGCYDF